MTELPPIEHLNKLTSGDFTDADEPFRLFAAWYADAERSEPADASAMTLATVDADGLPNARMVLMKGFDEQGFVFYTNLDSQKGRELGAHPKGALVFHWKIAAAPGAAARTAHAGRGRSSPTPISPAVRNSRRSAPGRAGNRAPLESRMAFEKSVAFYMAKFAVGGMPRPANWSGFRLQPLIMEFWQDRPFRLHDRIEFHRGAPDEPWRKTRLYP